MVSFQLTELTLYFAGGFTRSGHPLLILPDIYKWYEVLETELNLLLKYYCHIIPRAEQVNITICNTYMVTSAHESAGFISWRGEEREIIKLIKSQKLNQYSEHEILLLIVNLINLLFTLLRILREREREILIF